jgi:hypothetical protein
MTDKPLTVRDLVRELLDHPMDSQVYVGKGMGPLGQVESAVGDGVITGTQQVCVVLSPVKEDSDG